MLLLWKEDIAYWKVGLGYAFVGIGVGFAGTPASHSLTGSVPVKRVGMASGTADLQRDLGGAIMQSIFGALLTAGYAAAASARDRASGKHVSDSVQSQLDEVVRRRRGDRAAVSAVREPDHRRRRRRPSCTATSGRTLAGIVAVLLGAALVFFFFPKRDDERRLLDAVPRPGHRRRESRSWRRRLSKKAGVRAASTSSVHSARGGVRA